MGDAASTIQIGDLTMNDGVAAAVTGWRWFASLEGWRSGSLKITDEDQAGPGHFYAPGYVGPKDMALVGSVEAADYDQLKAALDYLEQVAGSPKALATVTVNDAVPMFAKVFRSGDMKDAILSRRLATFEIGLRAPSGIRESVNEPSVALPGNVTNLGNHDAQPRIQVIGAAAGPITATLTASGIVIAKIDTALAAGQVLQVDSKPPRVVTIDGVNEYDRRDPVASKWAGIPPGTHAVSYSGGGTATLHLRHTSR